MKVYIITSEFGEYSDAYHRIEAAFDDKQKAEETIEKIAGYYKKIAQEPRPFPGIRYYDEGALLEQKVANRKWYERVKPGIEYSHSYITELHINEHPGMYEDGGPELK